MAYAAIEAYANEGVDRLGSEVTVQAQRHGANVQVEQPDIEQQLSLGEKLDLAVPFVTGNPSVRGRAEWARFTSLRRLRNDLVHLKERGYSPDAAAPSEYARLLRGDAATAAQDAAAIIEAAEPGWLPADLIAQLNR